MKKLDSGEQIGMELMRIGITQPLGWHHLKGTLHVQTAVKRLDFISVNMDTAQMDN